MNLSEFEIQYRHVLEQTLTQLQTAVLLVAQLELRIASIGQELQDLSQTVEEFVAQQRSE